MQAVNLVRKGWSIRKVARYMGFHHTAVMKWIKRAPSDGRQTIPTRSSRPSSHPNELPSVIVKAIIDQRKKHNRCAEIVHRELINRGIEMSLSSVKRTLKREGLIRYRSPWKKIHKQLPRPEAVLAGDLVQIDTIHIIPRVGPRIYVYTLIDIASRWAYAKASQKINTHQSLAFVKEAQEKAPFNFKTVQSDHGSEFSKWFTKRIEERNTIHRHSRIRQSNDNGHVERFNRTIQEECLNKMPPLLVAYQRAIREYLPYYNNERLHMGINFQTPSKILQVVPSY